ncbi:MAG: T9SS type A sorting domain-containing protein [Syntrophothermus sp.]
MKKLLLITFIFSISIFSQNLNSIADIEEFGLSSTTIRQEPFSILDSSTWTQTSTAPNPFGRVSFGVINDYLYIFNGQGATTLAMAYHIPTGTWVSSTPSIDDGYNSSYCVANGALYKLSGTGSTTFEKFVPDNAPLGTWTALTSGPSNIFNSQSCMAYGNNGYIYVSSGDYSTPANSAFARYNIQTNTWESLTGSPAVKRYGGMVELNGKIYLIGGTIPTGDNPTLNFEYNLTTNLWSAIAPFPISDINFTKWNVSTDGRYIWVVTGGGGYSGYTYMDKIYYYDPLDNTWHYESTAPVQRGLAVGLFLTGHGKLFYGSGNMNNVGTNFQTDAYIGTGGVYVPVELLSFSANVDGNIVKLNWSTATETNNNYFSIERSTDKIHYTVVGTVKGNGTTTEKNHYTFADKINPDLKYFYRLNQYDLDGESHYSNAIEISGTTVNGYSLSQNFPNPFNPSTTIKYQLAEKNIVELKVFNYLGEEVTTLVNAFQEEGNYEIKFNSKNLSSGLYFYTLSAGGYSETKKMILIK